MNPPVVITTERVVLRGWKDSDRLPFAKMNADATVMEFFPRILSGSESDALIDSFEEERRRHGFCPWAAETRDRSEFAGFVGLHRLPDYLPCAPGVEIGWRLAPNFWGLGLATEAARAATAFGFFSIGLTEIVSFTSAINGRSRRVMERIGMTHDDRDDFEHPRVPPGPLKRHVLYRLGRPPSR
jgi:RimJ/RimL family protein N-acetyltransferase